MATETELKLEVGDLQLLDCVLTSAQIRAVMQEDFSYIRMQTTYFDTEDGALSARHQSLRVRLENDRSVVTAKMAGIGHSRGEWEYEAQSPEEAIEPLIAQGAPEELRELAKKGLVAICGAQFTRITSALLLPDGTTCELCGDLGEVFAGGKRSPICELELELKEGSEEQMLLFGRELMETFHLKEGKLSKFARAKMLI